MKLKHELSKGTSTTNFIILQKKEENMFQVHARSKLNRQVVRKQSKKNKLLLRLQLHAKCMASNFFQKVMSIPDIGRPLFSFRERILSMPNVPKRRMSSSYAHDFHSKPN